MFVYTKCLFLVYNWTFNLADKHWPNCVILCNPIDIHWSSGQQTLSRYDSWLIRVFNELISSNWPSMETRSEIGLKYAIQIINAEM